MTNEAVDAAQCTRCTRCHAWLILDYKRTSHPEPEVNEVKCPVANCGTTVSARDNETRMWNIPRSWVERGYFYDGELAEL
jgi:hypothetical protein